MADHGTGDRGRLIREALAKNPKNEDDGQEPSYIDDETLDELKAEEQLSEEDVAVVRSQRRE
jgi:hypothetical protein